MRYFYLILLLLFSGLGYSQNVAINTSGTAAGSTNMLEVTQTSTAAYMVAIHAINSGANAATDTGYAFKAVKTGATGNNVAGYFSATGGGNNYAIVVPKNRGNVGIGTITPQRVLHIENGNAQIMTYDIDAAISWTRPAWVFGSFAGAFYIQSTHDYSAASALTRLAITENGVVGIGTVTPGALLHVNPTYTINTDINGIQSSVTYNGAGTMANYRGLYVSAPAGTGTITNKYALVTETAAGNVGLGLTSPSYQLHVSSASAWSSKFASTAAANGGIYVDAANGFNANIGLQENAVDKWYLGNRASNDRFSFIDAGGSTEVFTILQGGNVGVGTNNPSYKMQIDHTGDVPFLLLNTTSATNERVRLQFGQSGTPNWELATDASVNNTDNLYFYNRLTSTFGPVILNNGNVGIGATAPGAKLEVQGTFKLVDGTQANGRVLTSDANGLASWGTGAGLCEWTDAGAYLRPADGAAERVSIGTTTGTKPFSTTFSQLFVYNDANYLNDANAGATVCFYNDENINSQTSTILDLQFGNATSVGADDKFIKFIYGLGTEVGSINSEVTYTTFTGAHVGQSDEDGRQWRQGMIVSSHGNPPNPTMGRAWVRIGLSTKAKDPAAVGAYLNTEFPHKLAGLDTTKPAYYYNALGEGLILVTDVGGDINIGDYITTSERAGYGMKQDDDLLHNYTVAKATDYVRWADVSVDPKYGFKWKLIACTYHGG